MVSYIVGIPGSGKTYKAVKIIYDVLTPQYEKQSKEDKKSKKDLVPLPFKFDTVYTNINGFRFDVFGDITKPLELSPPEEIPDNKTFDDYLISPLTKLYDCYQAGGDDNELNELAKELGVYKAMFVIDECHNGFDKENKVLVWWLSYHRHMYQEIILITQNLSLVKSKYKAFAEFFYQAFPSSMKLFKGTFKYGVYTSSRMFKTNRVNVEKIKFNQEVYDLYHSGDNQKSKNIILPYIVALAVIMIIVFSLFFRVFGSKKEIEATKNIPQKHQSKQTTKHQSKYQKKNNPKKIDNTDYTEFEYIKITCLGDDCRYQGEIIPEAVLRQIVKISHSKIMQSDTNKKLSIKTLYVLINDEFKNKFKRSRTDEKSNNFSPTDIFK